MGRVRPQHLHDYFTGKPHALLQRVHQPADPRVLASVHRAIREETPNLAVGKDYFLEGEVHEHAYFNIQPHTPDRGRRTERAHAVFVSAWWDRNGASAIFRTSDDAQVYFRVPLGRLQNGSVKVEGHGILWPLDDSAPRS